MWSVGHCALALLRLLVSSGEQQTHNRAGEERDSSTPFLWPALSLGGATATRVRDQTLYKELKEGLNGCWLMEGY